MRRRRWARERQEKREDKRPSAVVQGAALRKYGLCEENARGSWNPYEGHQPFRPNPNGVGDRTTTLRRLLIGADGSTSQVLISR